MSEKDPQEQSFDKEATKRRMLEEAKNIRIRRAEGKYDFDNPHLEHKSKWEKKQIDLEEKYGDAKIQFHTLDEEGTLKIMQMKKDKMFTTLGWSFVGNIFGVVAVRYIEKNNDKYNALRHFQKREMFKVFGFLGTVCLFTMYGYANAQQQFVKGKIQVVKEHSVGHTDK